MSKNKAWEALPSLPNIKKVKAIMARKARNAEENNVQEPQQQTVNSSYNNGNENNITSRSNVSLIAVNEIEHGLTVPAFDPNTLLPSDLFADTSKLPRTRKIEADATVEAIEEKRQTLRIVQANIGLARDTVKTGTEYQKLGGDAIDYATAGVDNQTKAVKYQTSGVNRDLAVSKLEQTNERLVQSNIALDGTRNITPLIYEEWQQRIALQQSKTATVKLAVTKANRQLEADLAMVEASIEGAS